MNPVPANAILLSECSKTVSFDVTMALFARLVTMAGVTKKFRAAFEATESLVTFDSPDTLQYESSAALPEPTFISKVALPLITVEPQNCTLPFPKLLILREAWLVAQSVVAVGVVPAVVTKSFWTSMEAVPIPVSAYAALAMVSDSEISA